MKHFIDNSDIIITAVSGISNYQIGFQNPATGIMMGIVDLHNHIFFFMVIVFIFVCWMLYVVCNISTHPTYDMDILQSRRSKKFETILFNKIKLVNFYDKNITHNSTLEIVWTVIPSIILFFIAVPSFALLYATDQIIFPELTVKIIGHQWYWSYEYGDSFDFVRPVKDACPAYRILDGFWEDYGIKQGFGFDSYLVKEPVEERALSFKYLLSVDKVAVLPIDTNIRLLVTSTDVIHSWAMPAFGIKVDAVPGRLNETFLHALRPGIFYGQCSEICGTGHGFMPICVAITSKKDFINWILYMRHYSPGWTASDYIDQEALEGFIDLIDDEDLKSLSEFMLTYFFRWNVY